jgi:ornithine cyclodeaminase/alanine dehydrogenase-like protein (mu-crystallin family)
MKWWEIERIVLHLQREPRSPHMGLGELIASNHNKRKEEDEKIVFSHVGRNVDSSIANDRTNGKE